MQEKVLQINISRLGDKFEAISNKVKEAIAGLIVATLLPEQASVQVTTTIKNLYMTSEEFKQIREELNITQEELAHILDYSDQPWVSQMERGKRKIPKDTAKKIRRLLEEQKSKEKQND